MAELKHAFNLDDLPDDAELAGRLALICGGLCEETNASAAIILLCGLRGGEPTVDSGAIVRQDTALFVAATLERIAGKLREKFAQIETEENKQTH